MNGKLRAISYRVAAGLCAAVISGFVAPLLGAASDNGNVDGAIFTSTVDATVVNENTRYGAKSEVYLNGGPQNLNANGLPDGAYYYQITDPSGKDLLSNDDIACRVLQVVGGRVAGVPADDAGGYGTPACYHAIGTVNEASGVLPVQMGSAVTDPQWFLDTPNNGGEYKAWITPVAAYIGVADHDQAVAGTNQSTSCRAGEPCHGFEDSHSKTDNFKIRESNPRYADLTVCKFNDLDGNGSQDVDEPFLAGWTINATDQHAAVTSEDGCVTFTYAPPGDNSSPAAVANFFNEPDGLVVTLEEVNQAGWTQTAPVVHNTVTVHAGDSIHAPDFGNHFDEDCTDCELRKDLTVTKTAAPHFVRTFTWEIEKLVDSTRIDLAAGEHATFHYTVSVTHDAGTDSGFSASGVIAVSNPNDVAVTGVTVSDRLDGCMITGSHDDVTIAPGTTEFNYSCEWNEDPGVVANVATVTVADGETVSSQAVTIDFGTVTPHLVDDAVTVTDTLAGPWTALATDGGRTSFEYANTVAAPAGTCTAVDNTATFTTDDSETDGSASTQVTVCGGVDLTVSKTAATAFTRTYDWSIRKSADKTRVEQKNGTATFNYTVDATSTGSVDSAWTVSGTISVTNPNDWQRVDANLADALDSAACTVTGGSVTVEPRGTASAAYSCTFASAPAADGTNTATATWDGTAARTAGSSAVGTAAYAFGAPTTEVNKTVTVTDTFNGTTTTLGSLTAPASQSFTYSHTVPNAVGGQCTAYNNTAVITETGQSSSQMVNVCNTATGGLTIGYWQNKNGQAVIKAANQAALKAYLTQYLPFQDLGTQTIATYVTNVIKAANASGAAMNAMLKAQMLATALNVYTSTTGLSGVVIDLTSVNKPIGSLIFENASSSFGPANSLTVSQMLAYAASRSNVGGSVWYNQVKSGANSQELAKDAFDAINNEVAWIAIP